MIKISKKSDSGKKLFKKIGIFLGALILSIYLLGVIIFSFVTLPNTKVNGNDVSYVMIDDVFNKDWTDVSIKLNRVDGKSDFFKPEKINYKEEYLADKKILQNQFIWPISFFTSRDFKLEVNISYDNDKFEEFLKNTLILKGLKHPEDAKIIYKDGKYEIQSEILGTYTTKEKLKEAILIALSERKDSIDMSTISEQPKLKKDDPSLQDALSKYEKISKLKYEFNIGSNKEVLDGEILANFYLC